MPAAHNFRAIEVSMSEPGAGEEEDIGRGGRIKQK